MSQSPTLSGSEAGKRDSPTPSGDAPRLRPRPNHDNEAPGPRRVAPRLIRPLPLVGIALVLVALIGYWSVYSATTSRTLVLVPTRDLPAGAVLRAADIRTAEVAGDDAVVNSASRRATSMAFSAVG